MTATNKFSICAQVKNTISVNSLRRKVVGQQLTKNEQKKMNDTKYKVESCDPHLPSKLSLDALLGALAGTAQSRNCLQSSIIFGQASPVAHLQQF